MLTYLLYALLAGFIAIAGYKTWQIKQEKENMAKANEEFQQSIRDLNFVENDTTESRFDGDENSDGTSLPSSSSTVIADDGIEDEVPVTTPKKTTPAAAPKTTGIPPPSKQAPEPAAAEPSPQKQPQSIDADTGGGGRYRVVAGSFTKLDGARREMERIIKMGYQDAEIGYFNRGKFATVVVVRTDNLGEAKGTAEALRKKGVDVRVVDRK